MPRAPRIHLPSVLLTLLFCGGVVGFLVYAGFAKRWLSGSKEYLNYRPVDPYSLRALLIDDREDALDAGNLERAADLNARLSQELLTRVHNIQAIWMKQRVEATHLYSQEANRPEWNYRNTAADFFSHLLHAGMRLAPESMPSLLETLAAELKLRTPDGLCQPVLAADATPVNVDQLELIFGSAEYVKDGLLSVIECQGLELLGGRTSDIVDAIIKASSVSSSFGMLPSVGAEVNGDMLQACSRLGFALDRKDYLEYAGRIADAYVRDALPANNGLPPESFDFATKRVIDAQVKLRDHGNEVIPGLAEAYAVAVSLRDSDPKWKARADAWAPVLAKMFQTILAHGVDANGLIIRDMRANPPEPENLLSNDNWGYVLNGAMLFVQTARKHGTTDEAILQDIDTRTDAIVDAVLTRNGIDWGGGADGYCDSLESALYVAAYRPQDRRKVLRWVDEQMEVLSRWGRGIKAGNYLDGNFIRTWLMHADARAGGWRVDPWREDVSVGFAEDQAGNAVIVVSTERAYHGRLIPEHARHANIMKLPGDWPRLNSWPEWFVFDPAKQSAETRGDAVVDPTQHTPQPLGLPENGRLVLKFSAKK